MFKHLKEDPETGLFRTYLELRVLFIRCFISEPNLGQGVQIWVKLVIGFELA